MKGKRIDARHQTDPRSREGQWRARAEKAEMDAAHNAQMAIANSQRAEKAEAALAEKTGEVERLKRAMELAGVGALDVAAERARLAESQAREAKLREALKLALEAPADSSVLREVCERVAREMTAAARWALCANCRNSGVHTRWDEYEDMTVEVDCDAGAVRDIDVKAIVASVLGGTAK